ncbi:hypothetical protein QHI69_02695 [Burkholderia gladioli pv. gladioli]|uniref:hypothetical protein n=1 Tax=Burkholderia gladioli TaxID=28095 RepID=UPI0024BC6F76|nr:hypothetical protein [Burkholderia gladioli]MDJ1160810.1 hypothetical protein [Burkholderia gladioli pv. gladioli]
MVKTKPDLEVFVRRGIDSLSCAREGFRRIHDALSAIGRLAEAQDDEHIAAVAILCKDAADNYLDLVDDAHKELSSALDAKVAEVSHG